MTWLKSFVIFWISEQGLTIDDF